MNDQNTIEFMENYLMHFNIAVDSFEYEHNGFGKILKGHSETLLSSVLIDVLSYCKTNDVRIVDFDDIKIIYFIGREASKLENNNEFLKTSVNLMNKITLHSTKKRLCEEMIRKIKDRINDNTWEKEYGNSGIYTIFKTSIRTYATT